MTRNEFIDAAKAIYGEQYDYSSVSDQGVKYNTNVAIKCGRHGLFYTTPYQFLHGIIPGCFECHKEMEWENKKKEL